MIVFEIQRQEQAFRQHHTICENKKRYLHYYQTVLSRSREVFSNMLLTELKNLNNKLFNIIKPVKLFPTICISAFLTTSSAQNKRQVATYVVGQYNNPFLEWSFKNNPWGIGLGAETFFRTDKKFQPTLDLAGNLFIHKIIVSKSGDIEETQNIGGNVGVSAGISLHSIRNLYISFVAGPTLLKSKFISVQSLQQDFT